MKLHYPNRRPLYFLVELLDEVAYFWVRQHFLLVIEWESMHDRRKLYGKDALVVMTDKNIKGDRVLFLVL